MSKNKTNNNNSLKFKKSIGQSSQVQTIVSENSNYLTDENDIELYEFCPCCGCEYDEIDYEYQICHICNFDASEKPTS